MLVDKLMEVQGLNKNFLEEAIEYLETGSPA